MKKICIAIFAIFLTLTFGMGIFINIQASENENIKKDQGLSLGIVLSSIHKESQIRLKNKFEEVCVKEHINVKILSSDNSSKIQQNQIIDLVRSGINVLVIDSVGNDSENVKDGIRFAMANSVKVLFLDSILNDYKGKCSYVGFNNIFAGEEVSNKIISYIESIRGIPITDNDKVNAIILKENNNSNVIEFQKSIKENCNGKINLLDSYKIKSLDVESVGNTLKSALFSYNKIDVIICSNDYIASLCSQVTTMNGFNVIIVGQDADIDACHRINESRQLCTVYKDYDKLVNNAVRISKNLYKGGIIEQVVVDTTLVDGVNLTSVVVGNGFHQASEIF